MSKLLLIGITYLSLSAQTLIIGTSSAELSKLEYESFESGILYGIGIEFNAFSFPIDIEAFYVTNNYYNANQSDHSFLQLPISLRLDLSDRFFGRAGIQYDIPLDGQLFGENIKKDLNEGVSTLLGFGMRMYFIGNQEFVVEGRYVFPQYNYLKKDTDNLFGKLNQFHISFGYKI